MRAQGEFQPKTIELTLTNLLTLMESGTVALPDFQRPYVWDEGKVRRLLASVLNGWPVGLILLMEAPPDDFFAMRGLEGGPAVSPDTVRHLVLDGQQRLTALLAGFGRPELPADGREWYLDRRQYERGLRDGRLELEDCLVSLLPRGVPRIAEQASYYVPLWALRSDESFLRWRDSVLATSLIETENASLYAQLNALRGDLRGVEEYRLPAVVLSRSLSLSTVAHVFERLNTSGLQLSTFDLVVAHVYRDGNNLRERWERDLREYPGVRPFAEDDPQIAVELIALIRLGDTRRDSLLRLSAERVWEDWLTSLRALDAASEFLAVHCGVANSQQLPNRAILLVLAGCAWRRGIRPEDIDVLRYWVFASALSGTFTVGVNTRVVSELRAVTQGLSTVTRRPSGVHASTLARSTRRASAAVWTGVEALIRQRNPSGLPVGLFESAIPGEILRPVCLVGASGRGRNFDPVMGMVLVSNSSVAEVEYGGARQFGMMLAGLAPDLAARFCEQQLMPPPGSKAYRSDGEFLKVRAGIMASAIEELRAVAGRRSGHAGADEAVSRSSARAQGDDGMLAVRQLRDVAAGVMKSEGPHSSSLPRALYDLGVAELRAGLHVDAVATLERCLRLLRELTEPVHPDVLAATYALAVGLQRLGRHSEALEQFASHSSTSEEVFGPASPEAVRANALLAVALARVGRFDHAVDGLARVFDAVEPGAGRTVRRREAILADELARAADTSDPLLSVVTLVIDILGEGSLLAADLASDDTYRMYDWDE